MLVNTNGQGQVTVYVNIQRISLSDGMLIFFSPIEEEPGNAIDAMPADVLGFKTPIVMLEQLRT